jgi:hypothetical protein
VSDDDGPEPVGSVAEEAAKLFGALSSWAREHGDGASAMAGTVAASLSDELHAHLATGSQECTWCPVCRTVAAVRQASPEVRAHLVSAGSSFLLAVSGMMATQTPSREAGVEHIDLDDDISDDTLDETLDDTGGDAGRSEEPR